MKTIKKAMQFWNRNAKTALFHKSEFNAEATACPLCYTYFDFYNNSCKNCPLKKKYDSFCADTWSQIENETSRIKLFFLCKKMSRKIKSLLKCHLT